MVCPHGQEGEGGWASADKGRGSQYFMILCRRLLWTAPLTWKFLFVNI